jgi:hypothetical protein
MGVYKDYPTFGINVDDVNDLVKIIRPQTAINFTSLSGSLPANTNGSLSLDPVEIIDVGPYVGGVSGTISNGRFGSSSDKMGFIISCPVVGSGAYVKATIRPSSSWDIVLSITDPNGINPGYAMEIDSSTGLMTIYTTDLEVLGTEQVDVSRADISKDVIFQWDGVRRLKATFGSETLIVVNDDNPLELHAPACIVSGNIVEKFEAGASEYFDNLLPSGPDRGVSLANIALSNPDVVWPGTDNAASLLDIIKTAGSDAGLSPFLTIDSAGPFLNNAYPGDIDTGDMRIGVSAFDDVATKYESGATAKTVGINAHSLENDGAATPLFDNITEIASLAVADIALDRIPLFSIFINDWSDTEQIDADFDYIISELEALDSYSMITIAPLPDIYIESATPFLTLEDWTAMQTLFKQKLDDTNSTLISFCPTFSLQMFVDNAEETYWIDNVWDFVNIYYSQGGAAPTPTSTNDLLVGLTTIGLIGFLNTKIKKAVLVLSFEDNTSAAADYYQKFYDFCLESGETYPQFFGLVYSESPYTLTQVNIEDTLTGTVPGPEDYPPPPSGGMQYIYYNVSNDRIHDISVDFRINSDMSNSEETYFQFYESDIGIHHQYFGVQTDVLGGDASRQLLIFSKFIAGGATPVRDAFYDEIRTIDLEAYPFVGNNEGNFASLRCATDISTNEWHNVRIVRSDYEVLTLDSTDIAGHWFDYYYDNILIGALWFEDEVDTPPATIRSSSAIHKSYVDTYNDSIWIHEPYYESPDRTLIYRYDLTSETLLTTINGPFDVVQMCITGTNTIYFFAQDSGIYKLYSLNASNDTYSYTGVSISDYPVGSVFADGYIYAISYGSPGNVHKIDLGGATPTVTQIAVGTTPVNVIFDDSYIWVLDESNLYKIDLSTDTVVSQIAVEDDWSFIRYSSDWIGYVWVGDPLNNSIVKINSTSGAVVDTYVVVEDTPASPSVSNPRDAAFDNDGNLWIANFGQNQIVKFDLTNLVIAQTIDLSDSPLSIINNSKIYFTTDGNKTIGIDPGNSAFFTGADFAVPDSGVTWTEFWPNNNGVELLPVPEQEFWIKPIKFNNSYDYTTVTSVYSPMPNSDTGYIASETPYEGYFRLRFGGDTPRAHEDYAVIDVTLPPVMVNSAALDKWIELINDATSLGSTSGTQTRSSSNDPSPSLLNLFAQNLRDQIADTGCSDIIIWKDMDGIEDDPVNKYIAIYQAIVDGMGPSYKYYGPNIDISARGEGYDSAYDGVQMDSRYMDWLQEFIDAVDGATPMAITDGIAFSGNFSDSEWPDVIDYIKSLTPKKLLITRIDSADDPDDAASENSKIAAMIDHLVDSDVLFLPGYSDSYFSIPDPDYAGYSWIFSAILDIPDPGAVNARIAIPAYSEDILGNPKLNIVSNSATPFDILHDVPVSGGTIQIGNLLENSYTINIFGDTISSGSASLRMIFNADNFDEITIFDTIYLEY